MYQMYVYNVYKCQPDVKCLGWSRSDECPVLVSRPPQVKTIRPPSWGCVDLWARCPAVSLCPAWGPQSVWWTLVQSQVLLSHPARTTHKQRNRFKSAKAPKDTGADDSAMFSVQCKCSTKKLLTCAEYSRHWLLAWDFFTIDSPNFCYLHHFLTPI